VEELESAELALSKRANKKRQQGNRGQRNDDVPEYDNLPDIVKKSLRPTKMLTMPVGKKVDKIEWLRKQVEEKTAEVKEARKSYTAPHSDLSSAVFVEFSSQSAAQKAYQQLPSSQVLAMNPRYIGVLPKEVIWDNLTLHPASRISQGYGANALVAATIIFWTIPITVVGLISNIEYLTDKIKFLGFVNNLPAPVIGLLTGLLPPFLTSLLVSYVPNIFRCKLLHRRHGYQTKQFHRDREVEWPADKHPGRIEGPELVLRIPIYSSISRHISVFCGRCCRHANRTESIRRS
jgi:hypothetical protein